MKYLKIYADSFKGLSPESWMLALVMLINRAGSMVLPFLGVYMTQHLHFNLKVTGIVLSFYGIGSVIGSWLGGVITDKIGEYKVQTYSLLLSVPLFCIIPLFKTEAGLAAIILILSIISESFRPANSVAVTKYATDSQIIRAFSLNRMAINLGFAIGPALGGILSAISYNFLFYCNAVGALLAGFTYIIFFRKKAGFAAKKVEIKSIEKQKSPYTDIPFLAFCFACLLYSVCFFQFLNTLTIFYSTEAQLSQQQIGYILGYSGFIIVLIEMILVQYAEKKFTVHFTLLLGCLLCGISFVMLTFNTSIFILMFSMTLLCVGEIWSLPFMATVTAFRSGENNKGAYMGLLGMAFAVSFIITPYIGTTIAENFGFKTLWMGTGILLTLAGIAFYYITPKLVK